jgi:long-chain acyl-CoA synthetase
MDQDTIFNSILGHIQNNPDKEAVYCFRDKVPVSVTYGDFGRRIAPVASWLVSQGIAKGDRVAILAENSLDWATADLAISIIGGVSVSVYPTLTSRDVSYILNNSDSTILFLQNGLQLEKVRQVYKELKNLKRVVMFEDDLPGIQDLPVEIFRDIILKNSGELASLYRKPSVDDPLCIIYTSGTTGPPKGAMLTHGNIRSVLDAIISMIPDMSKIQVNLSFLPLSHALERIAGYYMTFYIGRSIAFAESLDTIVENMKTIRPTHAVAVPRVFEKIFERIVSSVSEQGGLREKLFWWSVSVGSQFSKKISRGQSLGFLLGFKYKIAHELIFSKLKEAVGGRLDYFISGGAPLSKKIAEFFHAADILVLEGWGATETSAPATWNSPEHYRFGSVGRVIPGVLVRVAEDGELLIKGPTVFKEYWKMEAETREAKDGEGWYHTGDIGTIDSDGYVYITDRKKELIITAAGKNISPANIENTMKASPFISNIMAFGDKKKYITALVTLEKDEVAKHLQKKGTANPGMGALTLMPEVKKLITAEIERLNEGLARFEQIKDFAMLDNDFSVEDGLLTPTLKLKRKNIIAKYGSMIESLYRDEVSIW